MPDNDVMERIWEDAYSNRRKEWRSVPNPVLVNSISPNNVSIIPSLHRVDANLVASMNMNTTHVETDDAQPHDDDLYGPYNGLNMAVTIGHLGTSTENGTVNVDPAAVAKKWSLNTKQCIAYYLIINQSLQTKPEPLSLIITGAAGTGKSRIIHAAHDFLSQKNQSYRFRLASFTGIAAQNIDGLTLHSALALSAFRGTQLPTKTRQTLIQMWANVDFLFVDEYSMIGCRMLYKIHLALTIAKESSLPFGGVNMIFAGDFCQLPAVGETRLYAKFSQKRMSEITKLQSVYGKLLWLSIRNVVVLETVERQQGSGAGELISLLSRLREGKCIKSDYDFLCSRLAQRLASSENMTDWNDAPIIVSENATKDALNFAATEAFARRTGRHLYWYYCTDTHNGEIVNDVELKQHLCTLTSNNTNNRLGRIPLVIGMPVMIMTNFDVTNGVVNGRIGKLISVTYWVDGDGFRHATSCVVESNGIVGDALPGLEKNQAVALQDVTELSFVHPYSQKKCKIKRTQLPIQPAFSMTAYKSQGLSLERAVVDLESCSGSESPYVMVSRVKSLAGLMVLRPFRQDKICCNLQQDVHDELKRQRLLELGTLARHADGELADMASNRLRNMQLDELISSENTELDLSGSNLSTLVRREEKVTRQLMRFTREPAVALPSPLKRLASNQREEQAKRFKNAHELSSKLKYSTYTMRVDLCYNRSCNHLPGKEEEPIHSETL